MARHLDFYRRYGISPVTYGTDIAAHLERRSALYRMLGVLPLAIRGSSVLEVAPGSGQNSLYVAAQAPSLLTLVEPNPTAMADIKALYRAHPGGRTEPRLLECTLEEFESDRRFDIVICENWLGSSDHERGLLRKLAGLVDEGGVLIVTAVSPIGLIPNVIRRVLATRIVDPRLRFEERRALLVDAFGRHLSTLTAMTRSAVDWVQDNMINPAYYGICLTPAMLISELSTEFEVLASSPALAQDWRWFKTLHGAQRVFNAPFLAHYWQSCHALIDHRMLPDRRDAVSNHALERAATELIDAARTHEELTRAGHPADLAGVVRRVNEIMDHYHEVSLVRMALSELLEVLDRANVELRHVRDMQDFSSWFGRETLYVSLTRERRATG